ncbi:hypothetical protein KM043_010058 [Ampulex compressa]|nr:hypothetical protein KM043_010058 [Ampulex compressa]
MRIMAHAQEGGLALEEEEGGKGVKSGDLERIILAAKDDAPLTAWFQGVDRVPLGSCVQEIRIPGFSNSRSAFSLSLHDAVHSYVKRAGKRWRITESWGVSRRPLVASRAKGDASSPSPVTRLVRHGVENCEAADSVLPLAKLDQRNFRGRIARERASRLSSRRMQISKGEETSGLRSLARLGWGQEAGGQVGPAGGKQEATHRASSLYSRDIYMGQEYTRVQSRPA